MQNIIAKRLKAARQQAALTQQQLSDRMGFKDRQTIATMEAGSRKVSAEELLGAMKILGRDLEYFTDPLRLDGEASFSWRTNSADAGQIGKFELWASRCLALYRYLTEGANVWTAPLRLNLTAKSSFEDAHRAAEWLSNEWKLGDVPATSLEAAVGERLRALVLYIDAPDGISGAAFKLPELSAILINLNESVGRRNFDLAHELFHILTWETIRPEHSEDSGLHKPMKRDEQLANCFASALLMPENTLRKLLKRAPHYGDTEWLTWVDESALKLRVSAPALQWRLVQLDLLPKKAVDNSHRLVIEDETVEERPRRFSSDFVRVLSHGIEDGRISVRRASALVSLSVDKLADLFREYSLEVPFEI